MKAPISAPLRGQAGFTLIEMVGVLAIMAIMAAVIVPNAIRSMDRAAVTAEQQNLSTLGSQVALYLRDQGVAPTPANWTTALANYAGLSPADLATNKRNVARVGKWKVKGAWGDVETILYQFLKSEPLLRDGRLYIQIPFVDRIMIHAVVLISE